tara:strand:- start:143 stop:1759 length:1617 start_codon:yes stop_codon:yes gene_type:complete
MPTILQLRRGTTAENAAYTGSVGELTVDTTLNKVILHDGSTAGGTTVGNLQGNIQIGKTAAGEIDTSSGNLTIDSAGGTITLDDNVTISGNLTVSGTTTTVDSTTISIQNSFVFEGATDDAHETTLTTIDPTADRTISLPNVSGTLPVLAAASATQITSTPEELNILDGVTATASELNALDGITSSTAELNILDGVTATAAELNLIDGSAAGTIANSKAVIYGSSGEVNATTLQIAGTAITSTAAELNILDGVTATTSEINLVDGGTSPGTTAVAGGDGIVTNDNGTMRQTTVDTFDTYLAATTKTLTNKTISGSDNTLSNIGNSSLSNSAITVSDGSNTTAVALGGTMTFAGTTNEVEVSESSGTVTIGLPNNVTISGNLTVSGDTTTVNTATLAVEDPLINLATGNNSSDAVDIGFYGLYDTSGSQDLYAGLFRDAGDGKFKLFKDNQAAPTTTVNTSGTGYAVATLVANLEATTATLGGSDIISTDNTKTLTNKTIVAGNNTISGLTSSHLASAVRLQILDSSGSTVKDLYGSAT